MLPLVKDTRRARSSSDNYRAIGLSTIMIKQTIELFKHIAHATLLLAEKLHRGPSVIN